MRERNRRGDDQGVAARWGGIAAQRRSAGRRCSAQLKVMRDRERESEEEREEEEVVEEGDGYDGGYMVATPGR